MPYSCSVKNSREYLLCGKVCVYSKHEVYRDCNHTDLLILSQKILGICGLMKNVYCTVCRITLERLNRMGSFRCNQLTGNTIQYILLLVVRIAKSQAVENGWKFCMLKFGIISSCLLLYVQYLIISVSYNVFTETAFSQFEPFLF